MKAKPLTRELAAAALDACCATAARLCAAGILPVAIIGMSDFTGTMAHPGVVCLTEDLDDRQMTALLAHIVAERQRGSGLTLRLGLMPRTVLPGKPGF